MWKFSSNLWQTFTKTIQLIYFHTVEIQVESNCTSMEGKDFILFKSDPPVNLTYQTSSKLWNLSYTVGLLQKWFSTWQDGFLKNSKWQILLISQAFSRDFQPTWKKEIQWYFLAEFIRKQLSKFFSLKLISDKATSA